MIGYGITAADDQGMKEVIRKGRWFYLCLGNIQMMMDIGLQSLFPISRNNVQCCPRVQIFLGGVRGGSADSAGGGAVLLPAGLLRVALHPRRVRRHAAAGHKAPARAGEAERAGHALLPHPPAAPGAHSCSLLLAATPQ